MNCPAEDDKNEADIFIRMTVENDPSRQGIFTTEDFARGRVKFDSELGNAIVVFEHGSEVERRLGKGRDDVSD